jgi:eukaryotic-like serine/threonine-protein kinase
MKVERWQKIKELYDAALKCPPDERTQFLDENCNGDTELRGEVESLLAASESAPSFLEKPAVGEVASFIVKQKLAVGQKLNHYQIIKRLGIGGMGEVYLAEDEKLHRLSVLKILSAELDLDSQYLRRFILEARAASALNHPNIITIYEIGESGGTNFIAMEYVEGVSLRRFIEEQQLNLDEAFDIAIQTASALAAAHGAGIIHRDIKPENIMVRPDGLVKVLDFGIAKQVNAAQRQNEIHSEATTQTKITAPGLVMGTAAYMSPEQARGKTCDARTDIWSLGIVLYEMITGHVPFSGDTNSDTIASILKSEPEPLSVHVPHVPRALERIVKKALGKDCEERYQVVKDLLLDLKYLQGELGSDGEKVSINTSAIPFKGAKTQVETPQVTETIRRKTHWLWFVAPALVLLASAAVWYFWKSARKPDVNYSASLTSTQITSWKSELSELDASRARFSPKGGMLAYTASKNGSNAIWLKQIGGGEAFTRRQDDAKEKSPLFSPDSEQIAYLSERGGRRGIWIAPSFGGAPVLLVALESISQSLVHWSKDGAKIYFELKQNLYAVDIASKQITKLTNFDEARPMERDFSLSPDEKRIVYADRVDGQKDLWTADANGENPTRLTNDAADDSNPIWYKDGERVIYNSDRNGIKQICLAFLDGSPPVQLTFSDSDSNVSDISADGTKILYTTTKDESDLWSVNLASGKEFQVTSDIGVEFWQSVAANGEAIAYQAWRQSSLGDKLSHCLLFSQKLDGDKRQVQLADDGFGIRWSPDGNHLAFMREASGNYSLWKTSAAGGDAHSLTAGGVTFGGYSTLPYNRQETQDFQWSPDSRSLIYAAYRSGVSNIWQTTADGAGEKQLTNNEDKNLLFFNPLFSPDGSRIVWSAMTANPNQRFWSLWIYADGRAQQIYQSEAALRLVGWSASGSELIVKSVEKSKFLSLVPGAVNILQVALEGGAAKPITALEAAYFQNIALSPDRKTLAFVSRQNGSDTIQILPSTGGTTKTLISSNDARVYFSSLVFAPDGKTLYYGKQANWQIISMINNFK